MRVVHRKERDWGEEYHIDPGLDIQHDSVHLREDGDITVRLIGPQGFVATDEQGYVETLPPGSLITTYPPDIHVKIKAEAGRLIYVDVYEEP